MTLSELIRPEGLLLDIEVSDKAALLDLLADRAAQVFGLDRDLVLSKLSKREELGSTGIGHGIALPHCPCTRIDAPALLFARLKPAIEFQAVDERPVDLVLMLLLPKGSAAQHLPVLSMAARVLRQPDVAKALRHATAEEIPAIFHRAAATVDEEKRSADL
ncbi:PTS sugar transporter subunit IIA [Falsirhodobacter sp. 20TX0035]|uniref:PTS sugar transporter subunit IIA n=1 Tax=Falsirhodobacter sp. 20TX0035 TaxID=3022019 RepID=UPI00232BCDD8|nr:PTS sugar transporter subunit IIA [Falsirhodobacter sp. 20TX0035]MDB6452266.1 PTS sugar transporter subunit IIA [Falsirhodobacter sp. 20TX0035]